MIVVSNTSPLSNLAVIGQLSMIQQVYSRVVIPPAVYGELIYLDTIAAEIDALITAGWLGIVPVSDRVLVEALEVELDAGEAEAIALALELQANRLLIDERLGRSVANQYGLKITGLIGVLAAAKAMNIVPALRPVLDQLIQQAGFRVSRELYDRALRDAGE